MLRAALSLVVVTGCTAEVDMSTPPAMDGGVDGGFTDPIGDDLAYRFAGRLAASPRVQFGGGGYCDYAMTLRDVIVDIVVRERGFFVNGLVTDTAVEEALNGCPHAPSPPHAQVYEYTGNPLPGAAMFAVGLTPDPGNAQQATLDAVATVSFETAPRVDLRWHRIDQPAPLDWDIRVDALELAPVPCMQGAVVCHGRGHGTLYSCVDGTALRESKRCASGCASSSACR